MSKTNGDETPTPDALRAAAELAIKLTTAATNGPYRIEQSGNGNGGKYLQRVIKAAKVWRRRPVPGRTGWPEFDDVATIMGGMSDQAMKNGELLAQAPELLKMLARGVLRLQFVTTDKKHRPSIGSLTPTDTVIDLMRFLEKTANAMDCVVKPDHSLGDHPIDHLIGGSTNDRKNRAELLRNLADVLDPLNDEARKRKKHRSVRLNGIPTISDFKMVMPESLRAAQDTNIQSEADFLLAAELAHYNLITQDRYNVDAPQVLSKIIHREAYKEALRVELEYDCVTPLEVYEDICGNGPELVDENGDLKLHSDAVWKWYEEHIGNIGKRVGMLETDRDWLQEKSEMIFKEFESLLDKEPSGRGLISDVFAPNR